MASGAAGSSGVRGHNPNLFVDTNAVGVWRRIHVPRLFRLLAAEADPGQCVRLASNERRILSNGSLFSTGGTSLPWHPSTTLGDNRNTFSH